MDLPPPSYDDVVFSGPDTSPQAVAPAAPPYFEEDVPEVVVKQPLFSTNGSNLLSSADASNQNAPPAPPVRQDKSLRQGDRLIIDFEKVSCCPWETTGLPADCEDYIPEELYSKGITNQMWHEWCTKLNGIQAKSPSVAGCLCLFCIPGFIAQCVLCAIYSPTSAHHPCDCLPCFYGDWYHELKKWQRNVNYELNKRGMHAKLKTYKPHSRYQLLYLYRHN